MRLTFCRPIRVWKFLLDIQPTVPPWATFCRASGALAVLILFFAVSAMAQTNTLSDAEIQGHELAQQLYAARPTESISNSGILHIRNEQNSPKEIPPVIFTRTSVTQSNWLSIFTVYHYQEINSNSSYHKQIDWLVVTHVSGQGNQYKLIKNSFQWSAQKSTTELEDESVSVLSDENTMIPFANSDFWVADFGLEFFHWPAQKILPKTTNLKRGREYTLLESTNPNPSTNGYSRVLSWIDKETGGILEAEAYDFNGKLLKDFAPKSFKKVNGQWELQEMEIRNVQTGSSTKLEFDLKK